MWPLLCALVIVIRMIFDQTVFIIAHHRPERFIYRPKHPQNVEVVPLTIQVWYSWHFFPSESTSSFYLHSIASRNFWDLYHSPIEVWFLMHILLWQCGLSAVAFLTLTLSVTFASVTTFFILVILVLCVGRCSTHKSSCLSLFQVTLISSWDISSWSTFSKWHSLSVILLRVISCTVSGVGRGRAWCPVIRHTRELNGLSESGNKFNVPD